MQRKITTQLLAWKKQTNKKPLILFGARQTGKTTSVLAFGKEHYAHTVHVDFIKQPQLKAAFNGDVSPASIVARLSALLHLELDNTNTLLFLDEIQECDAAITSLKYFQQEMPELDLIAAGSLLGVHVARNGSFPVGYVDMETMHPMDFEEFCWAIDETRAFDIVKESYDSLTSCALHEHMIELYRSYLLVGGMPEVVAQHANGKHLEALRDIQENIHTAYVADMTKYTKGLDAAKIVACWNSLPAQLAKESGSTKFMWKTVGNGAKAERHAPALDWLIASGIVNRCTKVSAGVAPLKSFEEVNSFKIYMGDTGLLSCAYNAQPADFETKDARTARFRGGVAENYVMQQLVAHNHKSYYWGMQSTNEVEFIIRNNDGIIPIEVKSGHRVQSRSAKQFAQKYECPYVVRISTKNFGLDNNIKSIPLYAACLI